MHCMVNKIVEFIKTDGKSPLENGVSSVAEEQRANQQKQAAAEEQEQQRQNQATGWDKVLVQAAMQVGIKLKTMW